MKEATGEVSMTVIVIVAVAVIGGILAALWPSVKDKITNAWGGEDGENIPCPDGYNWNTNTKQCDPIKKQQ